MANAQISQASIDENRKASGGKAGDQTGKETNVRKWYQGSNGGWQEVIRCKNPDLGKKAAAYMVKLIDSNLVGYNQAKRNTLWNALKKNNWSVDKYISSKENTETDCSAFVYAAYCCVIEELRGYIEKWKNSPTCSTSWNMCYSQYPNYFEKYTSSEMISKDDNLIVGDMLNVPGHHIVMVCSTDGSVKISNIPPTTGDTVTTSSTSSGHSSSSSTSSVKTGTPNKVQNWSAVNRVGSKRGTILGSHMKQK